MMKRYVPLLIGSCLFALLVNVVNWLMAVHHLPFCLDGTLQRGGYLGAGIYWLLVLGTIGVLSPKER
jgi:hypothetical protein